MNATQTQRRLTTVPLQSSAASLRGVGGASYAARPTVPELAKFPLTLK